MHSTTLDLDFKRHLGYLATKYGEDMNLLNGLSSSQLDRASFKNKVRGKNVVDASIDGNANHNQKDMCTIRRESCKPTEKLHSLCDIFMKVREMFGLEEAKYWLEGEFNGAYYLHNAQTASSLPYCYAYDLTKLAKEGLFYLSNYNAEGPKHLTTFLDDVIEFISFMCNRTSGAVGIPNVLIWTYYFWKHDVETGYYLKDPDYYRRQMFQKLIYRLNQPFLRIDESAFVNVSIFDRPYLMSLFGSVEYPDGTFVVDQIEPIIEHQKAFMEVVSEIRSHNMFTFPVLTYSLLKRQGITEQEKNYMLKSRNFDVFVDSGFARWCSDHNTKWNDSNFFMSTDVGVLSNCCFHGNQTVLAKSGDDIILDSFWHLYETHQNDPGLKVYHNGHWADGHMIRLPGRRMYHIITANGQEITVTDNHICPTQRGDIPAMELTRDDYLLFSNRELHGEPNRVLKHEDGLVVGAAIMGGRNIDDIVEIRIPHESYFELKEPMKWCGIRNGDEVVIAKFEDNGDAVIAFHTLSFRTMLEQFVTLYKDATLIDNCNSLKEKAEFRRGIIDGISIVQNNGVFKNTFSVRRAHYSAITAILTSLGLQFKTVPSTDGIWVKLVLDSDDDEYDESERIVRNNSDYWRILQVEPIEDKEKYVYCFEMENYKEPYFTLPNGIITHNCRLLSDTRKLDAFVNSIGGTALSIGSVQVNTINLVRIAYEARARGSERDPWFIFLDILCKRVQNCCNVLHAIRELIKENIDAGLLPNYCEGGIELDKQYCTIGILGLYESLEILGLLKHDEFGNVLYTDMAVKSASEIFDLINTVKDNHLCRFSFNIESVPAERAAVILCQKDNRLYRDHLDKFIYSNQWIPLTEKTTVQEKLRICSILDAKCSGGSIAHINLESNFPNTESAWETLNLIALEEVIYFAFNTRINVCKNNHGFIGTKHCPACGLPVNDTYQRIVGFITPASNYSTERFKEFSARKWFNFANEMRD